MKGTEHKVCEDYWRFAKMQRRSWSLEEKGGEKKKVFLVSVERKALVISTGKMLLKNSLGMQKTKYNILVLN